MGDIRSRRIVLATMCKSMATGYGVVEKGVNKTENFSRRSIRGAEEKKVLAR